MTIQTKTALSLMSVKVTVHKKGDEIFEKWFERLGDKALLLPRRYHQLSQCAEPAESEYGLPVMRFKHRVFEFDFSHCGDGYHGQFSAMEDWHNALGNRHFLRDEELVALRDLAFQHGKPYDLMRDGRRMVYVVTTLWYSEDETDDEDEDYGEFSYKLLGVVSVDALGRMAKRPVLEAQP